MSYAEREQEKKITFILIDMFENEKKLVNLSDVNARRHYYKNVGGENRVPHSIFFSSFERFFFGYIGCVIIVTTVHYRC